MIRDKQAKLDAAVRDVSDRDTAIQQLESMFESTTHRYNKRRHIKLTHKMVIQATSVMTNASSHVVHWPITVSLVTENSNIYCIETYFDFVRCCTKIVFSSLSFWGEALPPKQRFSFGGHDQKIRGSVN